MLCIGMYFVAVMLHYFVICTVLALSGQRLHLISFILTPKFINPTKK